VIVDSSAIVAIAMGEKEQVRLIGTLGRASSVRVAAPTWFEASLVLSNRMGSRLDVFMSGFERQFAVQLVPFDAEHARVALDAWQRYGKGKHPAKLNFGDCVAYAVARVEGEPLLFIGNDFTHTDVAIA
jgi:ribonuclease VapC